MGAALLPTEPGLRCVLFLGGLDPWTPRATVGVDGLRRLVAAAQQLIRANAGPSPTGGREVGLGPDRLFVYGRAGRPCRRCATLIRSARLGFQARTAYWCPSCQPGDSQPPPVGSR